MIFIFNQDPCEWMSTKGCADLLMSVKPHNDRVGPLVVVGLLNDTMQNATLSIPSTLTSQVWLFVVDVICSSNIIMPHLFSLSFSSIHLSLFFLFLDTHIFVM